MEKYNTDENFVVYLKDQASGQKGNDQLEAYRLLWYYEQCPETIHAIEILGKPTEEDIQTEYDYYLTIK